MEKILDLETVLTFGKHKGKALKDLLNWEDISYVEWLREKTDWKFTDVANKKITERIEEVAAFNAQSKIRNRSYSHDAAYGQAFDSCAGGLMY